MIIKNLRGYKWKSEFIFSHNMMLQMVTFGYIMILAKLDWVVTNMYYFDLIYTFRVPNTHFTNEHFRIYYLL